MALTSADIQKQIDEVKPALSKAEDEYCFAIAAGRLQEIAGLKATLEQRRNEVSVLVKKKLAAMKRGR